MKGLSRNQVLASLAAVFVAGAVAGVAVGYPMGRQATIQRPPHPPRDMATHLLGKYTRDLALTTNQVAQVEPMLQDASQRVRALHKENFRQTDAIMQDCNRRILALLEPAQQQRFKEMEERRDKWFRERQAERERERTKNGGPSKPSNAPGEPPLPRDPEPLPPRR